MATQNKSNPVTESLETATEQLNHLNEKALASTRKASEVYLSSYEKAVVALVDSYEKAAGVTPLGWVTTLAGAQADFAREVTKAYASAARELVS